MRTHLLAWGFALAWVTALAVPSVVFAVEPVVLGPIHEEGTDRFAKCKGFFILDEYVLDYTLDSSLTKTEIWSRWRRR